MKKYEDMTLRELQMLPNEEFEKIPIEILDKAAEEHIKNVSPEKDGFLTRDILIG
ncbi:MAG: hypothetical protein Q4P18_03340 [Methanobrevibacter sp.]|uniref:hypothetical protein n=1 Tax=Methanobrevibacter sp. TaxID=66852 RepID=UPI0026DFD1E9|nr:hypothetical protein [Methanobrevibacter sp.]MDO5848546.1 hypothetical protein [Methanobrevibacter sp.]